MKTSSVRDAVALIEFADILERGMKGRVFWDELDIFLSHICYLFVVVYFVYRLKFKA